MKESVKMWNSLRTHVENAERDCGAATQNRSDERSREGLQWCRIKYDHTSHSVECSVAIENFMTNPTVAIALGLSSKHPLCVEMVPNKFQVDAECWAGELDVIVSQTNFSDEYPYHSHMREEICGPCYIIPNIVKDYFRLHFPILNGETSEGNFFTGLLKTLVRRLTQINAGDHCCVCGRLTSSSGMPGQILWPCAESLICEATYETWRNVTADDIKAYVPLPNVTSETIPSYEAWQSVPSVDIRKRGSEKYAFGQRGSKKNELENDWSQDFKREYHSYNRPRGWLRKIFSCLGFRFCLCNGRAVNSVGPG